MAELNGLNQARCGCRIKTVLRDRPERELAYCPMHKAAFAMREALRVTLQGFHSPALDQRQECFCDTCGVVRPLLDLGARDQEVGA